MSDKQQDQRNKCTTRKQATPEALLKSGPDPVRVKIDMDWKEALGEALQKERPKDGWP